MARKRLTYTHDEVQELLDKINALGPATTTEAGTMTPEDKIKLEGMGIYSGTTAYWNAQIGYIPQEGEIIIYTDYKTVEQGGVQVNVPGIKIGSGNGYVQDLVFVDEANSELLMSHISNNQIHITPVERDFWNNKLNVTDMSEVVDETLIFNRN